MHAEVNTWCLGMMVKGAIDGAGGCKRQAWLQAGAHVAEVGRGGDSLAGGGVDDVQVLIPHKAAEI